MHWIAALALTVGGPFGFWLEEPPQFMRLDSSGGWPGQAFDFHRFLPPAISAEHRLSPEEKWQATAIMTYGIVRPRYDERLLPSFEPRLPPPVSLLRPVGPADERTDDQPSTGHRKMLQVDATEGDHLLLDLADGDERVRLASVKRLGRLKLLCAVDALTAALRDDPSGVVREAAARALTVLDATSALHALRQAADADPDANVRRTALFAVEILEARGMPGALEAPAASQPPFHFFGFFN